MTKLPVFKTIGRTFGFVVERRFFALLRLIWLPAFFSVVIGLLPACYQFAVYGFPPDAGRMQEMNDDTILNLLNLANVLVSILLSAMIAIAVHRMILLDDQQKGIYFYWRLTREEWLYVAAWIGYSIIVTVAFLLPIAGHGYWMYTHEWQGQIPPFPEFPSPEATEALRAQFDDPRLPIVGFLSVLFMLVALARFGLVFPIIVAEGRLSFARSWQLTRGNFLRLIGFWIVVTVLAYVLILTTAIILGLAIAAMVSAVLLGGETVGALGILMFSVPAAVSLLVYLVVGITIFIAAMSFTYKALAEPSAEEAEPAGMPAFA